MAKAASLVGAEFCARLRVEAIDLEALSGFLDSLEHAERVEAIRSAGRREQKNNRLRLLCAPGKARWKLR